MLRKHISALVLLVLFAASAPAEVNKVAEYVKAEMKSQRIPGLSLAIVKKGQIILAEGYGLANVELNVPARPETVFKIGSVSKQFIATGIMLLVEEGRVGLDDKVSKYFEQTPDAWNGISVRHLLTHTSGIVREAPGFDPFKVQSDADVIKTAYPLPLRFQPGEKWEYCNVGYFLLAEIIHKVSGKPWGDYLDERVFSTLEMKATRTTSARVIVANRADGYIWNTDKLQNADDFLALRPSGAFLSSVLDLAKWEAALYTDRILKQTSRDQMWTQVTLRDGRKYPYGFGWELDDVRGVPAIKHGGSLPGFRAQYLRLPGYDLTIIVLCNLDSANVAVIARGVASLYIPDIQLTALQPQPVPDQEMTKMLRGLLENLANGLKDLPSVTSEFRAGWAGMSPGSRAELGALLKKEESFDFLTRKDVRDKALQRLGVPIASIWHYKLSTADLTRYYSFYLTAEKRIAFMEGSSY